MLSESDQLVSQTLYHAAPTPSAATEIEEQKPSYFQRIITRSKQQLRSPEGQQISIATPEDFVAGNSEDFPAIKTTYHLADYIISSERASSETLAFVDTIQQVRHGIGEATRLCVSPAVSNFLDAYPNKRTWATDCLQEAQQTLNDIGKDMDSTWVCEDDGGTVASKLKFEWGLKNQKRLLKRQQQLNQCHIHLMGVIHVLQTAELCSKPGVIIQEPIYEAPVRPMVLRDERDTLRGPYSRQKHRLGYNYASISSLTLALEDDKDDVETSVNSTPVELEGSTPSELSENQHVHYLLGFQTSRERLTDSPSLFRRRRASSDYVRQTAISGVTSRASIDSMIGRHDSISSTSPAVGVPMVARRYRATSIDIQSHNVNYKPRAQQPHVLKNQPSLVDDLADNVLPNMAVKRLPSEEWAVLPTRSGRPSPVTKSLAIDHPVHVGHGTMITPDMATRFAPQSMEESGHHRNTLKELHSSGEEPEPTQKHVILETVTSNNTCTKLQSHEMFDDGVDSTKTSPSYRSSLASTSHPSVSSLTLVFSQDEGSVCRPSGQRPSQRKSKNKVPAEFSNTNQPSVEGTGQLPRFPPPPPPPPMIVIDDACLPILATETELPEDIHDENTATFAFQQKLQGELGTNPVAGSLERRTSVRPVELSIEPEQPINALLALKDVPSSNGELEPLTIATNNSPAAIAANRISTSWSNESREDLVGKKPMSAQAKRRAAHARRMHLAFGNVANT